VHPGYVTFLGIISLKQFMVLLLVWCSPNLLKFERLFGLLRFRVLGAPENTVPFKEKYC
jgi:hypothetical protein